ncbi:hypothetical protein [Succinatimonas hippei]|uniref:hypothetical protein n=1 Tax=Succinatimonas hippei TaxID=626938 RepID=UPI0026EA1E91|nr:hypothetical protein [Succinatimonas hippei]
MTLKALTQKNVIAAGNLFVAESRQFGTSTAIEAMDASSVHLNASLNNELYGSVYTKDSSVNIYGIDGVLSSQNIIRSASEIENAGNIQNIEKYDGKRVISALYAEGEGASIVLNGELNTVQTYSAVSRANTPNFIKIKGNAIAGNGGKLSIDLGNGGTWIGRADDYQDAGGENDKLSA